MPAILTRAAESHLEPLTRIMMVASMVLVPLCILLLGQSLMAEPLTSPVSSERVERAYNAQVLAELIDNLTDRLKSLEANITEQGKTYGAKALADLVDNLASRLTRLEANVPGRRNEVNENRCETGVLSFTPHGRPGVLASDGSVRRIHSVHVIFSRPFTTKPWVSVAITHLDVYNDANVRVDVGADAISTSSFDAFAYEWADTNIVLVKVSWVACNI